MKRTLPAMGAFALVIGSAVSGAGSSTSTTTPAWYGHGHRVSSSGDLVVRALAMGNNSTIATSRSGSSCAAEASKSGNVQVNCLAEDGSSPQNTQSETSVAAYGNTVVVGYNDSLVCCVPAINFTGYSVSTNGGINFTDKGDLPWQNTVQPIGDPSVAHDDLGNFYFVSLALSSTGFGSDSLISFYEMPAGSTSFQLVSVPVNVGNELKFFADKEYLAVGKDQNGATHFYITWTSFSSNVPSPIMLTDSTDGIHWRTTRVSAPDACAQGSNPVPAGGARSRSY